MNLTLNHITKTISSLSCSACQPHQLSLSYSPRNLTDPPPSLRNHILRLHLKPNFITHIQNIVRRISLRQLQRHHIPLDALHFLVELTNIPKQYLTIASLEEQRNFGGEWVVREGDVRMLDSDFGRGIRRVGASAPGSEGVAEEVGGFLGDGVELRC